MRQWSTNIRLDDESGGKTDRRSVTARYQQISVAVCCLSYGWEAAQDLAWLTRQMTKAEYLIGGMSMADNVSVVPVTTNSCKPFTLEVMVFSPEAGFKFQVTVERSCIKATDTDPAIEQWKLVFDLYKQKSGSSDFDQIVHVSYTAANPIQQKKVAATAASGVNAAQSKQLITKVHPAVKAAANLSALPPDDAAKTKQKVKNEMSKTVDLAF